MHLLSVSYDLLTPGKDYKTLIARLEQLGARRVLFSQWMLKSNLTPMQLRDDLVRYIDTNDRLLVIDVTDDAMAWTSLQTNIKATFSLT